MQSNFLDSSPHDPMSPFNQTSASLLRPHESSQSVSIALPLYHHVHVVSAVASGGR